MSRTSFYFAWRYLRHSTHYKSISTMGKICFIGIFIGTLALTLVISIIIGFEQETYKTMQGVHASLIMQAPQKKPLAFDKISHILKTEFPEVTHFSGTDIQSVLLQADVQNDLSHVIALKGIFPEQEQHTTTLASKMLNGTDLSVILHDNYIALGAKLAQQLALTINDRVQLVFPAQEQTRQDSIKLNKYSAVVGGIFKTGIEEFDENLILCHFNFLQTLFPHAAVTSIGMQLAPIAHEKTVIHALKKRFDLFVYSWKDMYPALVAALTLEKYVSILVVALIVLIACMMIVALLFMLINQKRHDIAILRSMGSSAFFIRTIFMWIGVLIASTAGIAGMSTALIIGLFLKQYPLIKLPDVYYVSHLPIYLHPWVFMVVFLFVMFISFLTTWYATRHINNLNIADILRMNN